MLRRHDPHSSDRVFLGRQSDALNQAHLHAGIGRVFATEPIIKENDAGTSYD